MTSQPPALTLPRLTDDVANIEPLPTVGLAAFSDDIEPSNDHKHRIRVMLTSNAGRLVVDFRDTPDDPTASAFAITPSQLETAVTLAVAAATGQTASRNLAQRLQIEPLPPDHWLYAATAGALPWAGMTMARVYDTIIGALAQVWPTRVGSSSCSLGALVELRVGSESILEVLPGGEGATPHRDGASEWSGPIFATQYCRQLPTWLAVEQISRTSSGGHGARCGGRGVVRRYTFDTPVEVFIGLDRRRNLPHGIDRAGSPQGAKVYVEDRTGRIESLPPWISTTLRSGMTLVVETCGGAGHGFPGYGDVAFDPSVLA